MKGSKLIRSFMEEAREETRREDVAEVVRIRFGEEAASAVVPPLEQISDAERLRGLLALAIRCASLDEFRAGLAAPPGSPRRRRARSGNP